MTEQWVVCDACNMLLLPIIQVYHMLWTVSRPSHGYASQGYQNIMIPTVNYAANDRTAAYTVHAIFMLILQQETALEYT